MTRVMIDVTRREMARTWSLFSSPVNARKGTLKLLHSPIRMGWNIGDQIGVAQTKNRSEGTGQAVTIVLMNHNGITVDTLLNDDFHAGFIPPPILSYSNTGADAGAGVDADAGAGTSVNLTRPRTLLPALLAVEVVNLSWNIIITGDEFSVVECNSNLPESIPGKQTRAKGW
eukprot:CAMPEP_0194404928 /NCGR_PEP_ID=MMETSP0176-20130528/3397_1 /TAXON_ID=216777 /ORGANISM="Proboscia alata, Strain PI-D3" /LENGTH=171 /DNA_ID=CAMNT_0039203487 /DNA_START=73 /DNA_END=585 /DNA_ORIENTATION=+